MTDSGAARTDRAGLDRLRRALRRQSLLLPIRIAGRPLSAILALAEPRPGERHDGIPPAVILEEVARATRHSWLMRQRRCLRQGILAYRFLRASGARPELHFGVAAGSLKAPDIRAHCWIVLDRRIVLNPPEPGTVTILVHRPAGAGLDGLSERRAPS